MKLPRLPRAGNIFEAKYTAEQMKDYAKRAIQKELERLNLSQTKDKK